MMEELRLPIMNLAIASCFAFSMASVSLHGGENHGHERLRTRDTESELNFYGRVVNQYDKPVCGAKVIYELNKYGLMPFKRSVKTGSDGRFEIVGGRTALLFIKDVELDGYEYLWHMNQLAFEYRSFYNDEIRHKPDKEHPVVFHIRKREEEGTIVLKGCSANISFADGDEVKWAAHDFFSPKDGRIADKCNERFTWDLEATAENDPENERWILTLWTNGKNAGIQKSDKQLYMAPEEGYKQMLTIPIEYRRSSNADLHFFVRTSNPVCYIRIDYYFVTSNKDRFHLDGDYFMNPYGERLLEELDWNDEGHERFNAYVKEAQNARKARELATKPDVKKALERGLFKYMSHKYK